jgi:hypothetical protein
MALLLVSGFFASFVSLGGTATAQEVGQLSAYAPADAVFYGEFELDKESDQLVQATALLERANLTALLTEEQEDEVEMQVDNLGLIADGQASVFLTDIPEETIGSLSDATGMTADAVEVGQDPETSLEDEVPDGWALVIMPADVDQAFTMYSSIAFEGDATTAEESEYGGYTILNNVPEDEYTTQVFIAQVDDVIVVAAASTDVESVIDTVNGDSPALSADENFTMVRESLESDVIAFGYVNGPALLEQVDEIDDLEEAGLSDETLASYDTYAGFVFWADDNGFRMDSLAFPSGDVTFPETSAYDASFAAETPSDALFYSGGTDLGMNPGINLMAVAFASSVIGADSEGGSMFATPGAIAEDYADEVFAQAEEELGFNLKTDLLDQMVGEWAMAGTVENISESGADISALFVTELEDSAPVETIVSDLTAMMEQEAGDSAEFSTRDVNGSEVTSVDLSDDSGFTMVLEFGVVDDQLMIGVNEGIDFATLAEDGSLADDEVFQQTFEALPSDNVNSSSYLNVNSLLPLVDDVIAMTAVSELDADPSCAEYATQEEAQAAYDEDSFENWMLDQNFNDIACEDHFAPPAQEATPDSGVEEINVLSVGTVTFESEGVIGTSTIILIGE